eukprot:364565_1
MEVCQGVTVADIPSNDLKDIRVANAKEDGILSEIRVEAGDTNLSPATVVNQQIVPESVSLTSVNLDDLKGTPKIVILSLSSLTVLTGFILAIFYMITFVNGIIYDWGWFCVGGIIGFFSVGIFGIVAG